MLLKDVIILDFSKLLLDFPQHKLSIAVQVNSSDIRKLKIGLLKCLIELANMALRKD